MEGLRRTIATILLGGVAGALAAWGLRAPPPDRTEDLAARAALESRLGSTERALVELRREIAIERARIAQWHHRLAGSPSDDLSASLSEIAPSGAPLDPELDPLTGLSLAFSRLAAGGAIAANGPAGEEVRTRVEDLGTIGVVYIAAELSSPFEARRIAAAGIAERRSDPALIAPLAATVRDPVPAVRRAAVRALAALARPESAEFLLGILDAEDSDPAIRFHAWLGLARLGRREASERFPALLAATGGELSADFLVDAALELEDPLLLPSLRLAYDHPEVSLHLRGAILRRLARSGSQEWIGFLEQVVEDEGAPRPLREMARTLLGG